MRLAAYAPEASGAAEPSGDGARHRAAAGEGARRHVTCAIRPAVLARVGLAVVLLGALVAGGVLLTGVLTAPADPTEPAEPTLPLPQASPTSAGDDAAAPSAGPVATAQVVLVHVAGAVTAPGLVQLQPGDRVADAIDAAGGAVPAADLDRVNLAAPVADGERLYVPAAGETPPAVPGAPAGAGEAATAGGSAVVNVNTADSQELETLPGIGPARAADIIAHREQEGPFQSVADLLQVPGIGPATLDRLRDQVSV